MFAFFLIELPVRLVHISALPIVHLQLLCLTAFCENQKHTVRVTEHSSHSTNADGCEATAARTLRVAWQPHSISFAASKQRHGAIMPTPLVNRTRSLEQVLKERVANRSFEEHAVIYEEDVDSLMEQSQALKQQAMSQQEELQQQLEAMRGSREQEDRRRMALG